MRATLAVAVWMAATAAGFGCPVPASADPPVGSCDPQQLTVAAGRLDSGLGHRAVWLNFTLQPGAGSCQLSGYPTVDAEVLAETTLNPRTRTLLKVQIDSNLEADKVFVNLLGKDAGERQRLVMEKAALIDADDLDV